jgi:hypothetical protein
MFFVVLKPDKTPMETPFATMSDAQVSIEAAEPDLVGRSRYQIHPVHNLSDLKSLSVKHRETVTIEKFDGEYVGQAPVEVVEFKFGDA